MVRNFNIEIGTELNDQHVSLYIKDYGRVLVKDMPRIFERGFTSTANRNETTSSGVGLYLVNSVKDQLGIHHQVTSTVGKGTTVRLIFPLQNEIVERMSGSDKFVILNMRFVIELIHQCSFNVIIR